MTYSMLGMSQIASAITVEACAEMNWHCIIFGHEFMWFYRGKEWYFECKECGKYPR